MHDALLSTTMMILSAVSVNAFIAVFLLLNTGPSSCLYFQENLFQRKRRKRGRKTTKGGTEVVRIRIPQEQLRLTEMYLTYVFLPKQSEDF